MEKPTKPPHWTKVLHENKIVIKHGYISAQGPIAVVVVLLVITFVSSSIGVIFG